MKESTKRMTKLIHYTFVLTTEKMMRTRRSCWVECLWSRVLCENATKPPSIAPAIGKFKPKLRINQRSCLPNVTGCATRMLTTTLKEGILSHEEGTTDTSEGFGSENLGRTPDDAFEYRRGSTKQGEI